MNANKQDAGGLPDLTEEEREFSDAFERWRENYRALVRLGLVEESDSTELTAAPVTRH